MIIIICLISICILILFSLIVTILSNYCMKKMFQEKDENRYNDIHSHDIDDLQKKFSFNLEEVEINMSVS